MPRKRRPLVVSGQTVEIEAPGLKLRQRGDRVEARWEPRPDAVRAGFLPKTVRIHVDLNDPADVSRMVARCHTLWAEMLDWFRLRGELPEGAHYDGTLKSLIKCYQTNKMSPYWTVSADTRRGYDDWCRPLELAFGKRRVDRLSGEDFRRWYHTIMEPVAKGQPPRLRLAQASVRSMLSILLRYGAEMNPPAPRCLELAEVLAGMDLRPPPEMLELWLALRPKRSAMTFEQASAIVTEGLRRGTRRHRSVALGVAWQFELTWSQIDVIGSWERVGTRAVRPGAIVRGAWIWRPGLRYEDFGPSLEITSARHKTGQQGVYDLTAYPLVMRALAAVPEVERSGPVVIDDSGDPIRRRYYQDLFRDVADAAGVPRSVWNMTARHGGATEARRAGVALEDVADHLQHADINTTRKHYIEPQVEVTRRVAEARVKSRKKDPKTETGS